MPEVNYESRMLIDGKLVEDKSPEGLAAAIEAALAKAQTAPAAPK